MKILMTGAGGFLGRGMIGPLVEAGHTLRLMDVVPFESPHEVVVGDVCDMDACRRAMAGQDAVVMTHMAPNRPEVYATPPLPFDINAKGTANLFAAAVEQGVRKVVLISSIAVVGNATPTGGVMCLDSPLQACQQHGLYGLTKVCQEIIAEYYHCVHGVAVAMLRPGYITDADTLCDKYSQQKTTVNWLFIDRRDIGAAAACALRLSDLGCEAFYLLGHRDSAQHADVAHTRQRLGWTPAHDFSQYPDDAPLSPAAQ